MKEVTVCTGMVTNVVVWFFLEGTYKCFSDNGGFPRPLAYFDLLLLGFLLAPFTLNNTSLENLLGEF